jgi:hypothetical protein
MARSRGESAPPVERLADACEADERVLDHLAILGCDPAQPHEVRHFVYVPAQDDADAVASVLEADGWSTTVGESEGAWLVVATRVRTLTLARVRATRARLAALAAEHDGVYDGWEATA